MKYLITGSSGFIGQHLIDHIARGGELAVGLDRRPPTPALADKLSHVVTADINNMPTQELRALIEPVDCVVHLAAFPSVRYRGDDAEVRRREDNVDATRRMLEAIGSDKPVLAFSSSSVYGGTRDGQPCEETLQLRPLGGYASSKLEAEALHQEHRDRGAQVLTVRPFTVIGPGQRQDMAVSSWVKELSNNAPATIFGSPDRSRDIVDVRQVADFVVRLADNFSPGVVNIASERSVDLRSMVEYVAEALGVPPNYEVVPTTSEEVPHSLGSARELRRRIGDFDLIDARVTFGDAARSCLDRVAATR